MTDDLKELITEMWEQNRSTSENVFTLKEFLEEIEKEMNKETKYQEIENKLLKHFDYTWSRETQRLKDFRNDLILYKDTIRRDAFIISRQQTIKEVKEVMESINREGTYLIRPNVFEVIKEYFKKND